MPRHGHHRAAWALSLLLHGALLAWLLFLRPPAPPARVEPPKPDVLEIEIVDPPPAPEAPALAQPTASAPAAPSASQAPLRRSSAPVRAKPRTTAPTATGGEAGGSASAEGPAGTGGGEGQAGSRDAPAPLLEDVPRRPAPLVLGPPPSIARDLGVGAAVGPGAGVTTRPGDAPAPSILLDREAAEVARRVEGLLADAQAHGRVEMGAAPDYFRGMGKAFDHALASPPQDGAGRTAWQQVRSAVSGLARNYVAGAARYGASGNPYSVDEDPSASPASQADARSQGRSEMLDRYRDFVDGKFSAPLVALVEIRQAGDGSLLETRLVSSSGLKDFDEYVMGSVATTVPQLPPPTAPESVHPERLVSLWAFEGRIRYAAPLVGENGEVTGSNALYLVFGGSFEETTGEVWVNKLDEPRLTCRARLLAVY